MVGRFDVKQQIFQFEDKTKSKFRLWLKQIVRCESTQFIVNGPAGKHQLITVIGCRAEKPKEFANVRRNEAETDQEPTYIISIIYY